VASGPHRARNRWRARAGAELHRGPPLNTALVGMSTSTANTSDIEPTRGEGPGVITQDGCAVEVYLNLPYRDELEILAEHFPPRCSVLDLGCGTGRLTRRLLDKGHSVTAVDNSADMLRHVPDAATRVRCDIEQLMLDRTFDVVLLPSNLINVGEEALRRAQLLACRRHVAPRGALLFQRFDPQWLRTVEPGPFPSIGDVEITIERATRHGRIVHMSIRYAMAAAKWRQHFTARVLDDDDVRIALSEAGFPSLAWIDARWGKATGNAD
jgi:SAM-dependent methyltransferase